jgi:6-phosphofructokinase 1
MIPEVKTELRDVIKVLLQGRNSGKHHYIVVVAEGVGKATSIAAAIEDATGIESRATILGHLQRGGSPTNRDRTMASMMGLRAIECIQQGRLNRVIAYQSGQMLDLPLDEALQMEKSIDPDELARAHILSSRRFINSN